MLTNVYTIYKHNLYLKCKLHHVGLKAKSYESLCHFKGLGKEQLQKCFMTWQR